MARPAKSEKVAMRRRTQSDLIVDAATRCFRRAGFDGASTQMIADEAQLPQSLLYRYFRDKKAIIAAVSERYLDGLLDHLETCADGCLNRLTDRTHVNSRTDTLYFDIRASAERCEEVGKILNDFLVSRQKKLFEMIVNAVPDCAPQEAVRLSRLLGVVIDGYCFNALTISEIQTTHP
ncbi:TetR/AcrR family transcriptional regulator [Asticcacaulis sp. W401b]|uniref:TetR/AcrR family transcriptional regulator n=1 Tax=Asticcacaulis sp. W401b TaxID=3388666 RepID=UPI0039710349